MDHGHGSSTFLKAYLNRNVSFDIWSVGRGLKPQQDIMKVAASIGYHRNKNQPLALTPEQATALKDHPKYYHYKSKLTTLIRRTLN